MTSTYLSVDLDYWTGHRSDRSMRRFLDRCLALKVPTMLVWWWLTCSRSHWCSPADKLVNVDYHDDIVERLRSIGRRHQPALNDGNWVSHVPGRKFEADGHPLRHYKKLMRKLLQLDCTDPLVTPNAGCSDQELVRLSFSEVRRHLSVTS